jgi:hypothetical protein
MAAGAVAAVAMVSGPSVGPAGASHRSGRETVRVTIYEASPNGQDTVNGTGPIDADGVVDAHGVDVEQDSLPSDPPNTNRDALVFRNGTLEVVSTNDNSNAQPHVDANCNFRFRLTGSTNVVGGTGVFAHATGHLTDVLQIAGVVPRNPDGSCNESEAPPLYDVVHVEARGQLSL